MANKKPRRSGRGRGRGGGPGRKSRSSIPATQSGSQTAVFRLKGAEARTRITFSTSHAQISNLLSLLPDQGRMVQEALKRQSINESKRTGRRPSKEFKEILEAYFVNPYANLNGLIQLLALCEACEMKFEDHRNAITFLTGFSEMVYTEHPRSRRKGRRSVTSNERFEQDYTALTKLLWIFKTTFDETELVPTARKNEDRYSGKVYLTAVRLLKDLAGLVLHPSKLVRLAWLADGLDLDYESISVFVRTHQGRRIDDICQLIHQGVITKRNFWTLSGDGLLVRALGLNEMRTLLTRWEEAGFSPDLYTYACIIRNDLYPSGVPTSSTRPDFREDEPPGNLLGALSRWCEFPSAGFKQIIQGRSFRPGTFAPDDASILNMEVDLEALARDTTAFSPISPQPELPETAIVSLEDVDGSARLADDDEEASPTDDSDIVISEGDEPPEIPDDVPEIVNVDDNSCVDDGDLEVADDSAPEESDAEPDLPETEPAIVEDEGNEVDAEDETEVEQPEAGDTAPESDWDGGSAKPEEYEIAVEEAAVSSPLQPGASENSLVDPDTLADLIRTSMMRVLLATDFDSVKPDLPIHLLDAIRGLPHIVAGLCIDPQDSGSFKEWLLGVKELLELLGETPGKSEPSTASEPPATAEVAEEVTASPETKKPAPKAEDPGEEFTSPIDGKLGETAIRIRRRAAELPAILRDQILDELMEAERTSIGSAPMASTRKTLANIEGNVGEFLDLAS